MNRLAQFVARAVFALAPAWLCYWFWGSASTDGWNLTEGWWKYCLIQGVVTGVISAVVLGPLLWPAFLGCSGRTTILGMILIPVLSATAAATIPRVEELVIVAKYGEKPAKSVYLSRWFPFEHHSIEGNPESGWYGWD